MAIITTIPKAITAYKIFTKIFIVFGLAFTRSPFSKNYITMWMWVLIEFYIIKDKLLLILLSAIIKKLIIKWQT